MDPWIGVGLAGLTAAASAACALRERAAAVRARLAARIAVRRETTALAVARELVAASRESPGAVLGVLERAIPATVAQVDALALFERRADHLRCIAATGRLERFADTAVGLAEAGVVSVAARLGHRALVRAPHTLHPSDRATLAVPLLDGDRVFAVLAASARCPLAPAAVEAIVTLVEQAVPAYLLARDREEDRSRATVDALTGLLGPRAFRERVKAAVERARTDPQARLALLFLDSDRFKECNDRYGHGAGDLVLRALGEILRRHGSSAGDLLARNGGDEFCMVLGGLEKSQAVARAADLCAEIAAYPWDELLEERGASSVGITASIGVATFPRDARTAEELLEKADAAMYHSKRAGRNRVSYYSHDGMLAQEGPSAFRTRADGV